MDDYAERRRLQGAARIRLNDPEQRRGPYHIRNVDPEFVNLIETVVGDVSIGQSRVKRGGALIASLAQAALGAVREQQLEPGIAEEADRRRQ